MSDSISEPITTELQNIEARTSELMRYMDSDEDFNALRDALTNVRGVLSRREGD